MNFTLKDPPVSHKDEMMGFPFKIAKKVGAFFCLELSEKSPKDLIQTGDGVINYTLTLFREVVLSADDSLLSLYVYIYLLYI